MSNRTPSLLEPESRGGETAERGFNFQENILLAYLPRWLALDGFCKLTRESIGDTEVAIFVPGKGESREFLEVKNYRLTPELFWAEIGRFMDVEQGSPNTYQWFTLAAPDISENLKPLLHALRRIRAPYGFFTPDSGVLRNSIQDYRKVVEDLGQTDEIADFLYTRVLVDTSDGSAQEHGNGLFIENLGKAGPSYGNLSYTMFGSIRTALREVLAPLNTVITRREIELAIQASIPEQDRRPLSPVRLYTANQSEFETRPDLSLDWAKFSDRQSYPASEVWNRDVVGHLQEVKDFILEHRSTRHIAITGNRRLSASLAIGSVFSATGGFTVEMEYREDVWWSTADHAGEEDAVALSRSGLEFPKTIRFRTPQHV